MAKIGSDRMIVRGEQRADKSWLFTICYTAYFCESDLGVRFDDSVKVAEVRGDHPRTAAYEQAVSFTATSQKVFRKKRIVVRDGLFDDGPHLEAVCAWIRLHRAADLGPAEDEQRTPVLVPTPQTRPRPCQPTGLRRAPAQTLRC